MSRIFTSRFSNKALADMKNTKFIAIARGLPRFKTAFQIDEQFMLIAPSWGLVKETDPDCYNIKYRNQLNYTGVETIEREFFRLSEEGKYDIVLLCYEDVSKDWCHRRMFADWWLEECGEPIDEIW